MKWWKSTAIITLALTMGAISATGITWPPGPDRGAPTRTVASGVRGNCVSQDDVPAFALVPDDTIALAKNDRPVLFAYLPDVELEEALLKVDNLANAEKVVRLKFDPPALPAIVALRLPEGTPLKSGEIYRWSITLSCGNTSKEEAFADMQPVAIPSSPSQSEVEQQAQWYADRLLWHDTLETLARAWEDDPQPWQAFLDSWEWETSQSATPQFLEELSTLREVPVIFVEPAKN